MMHFKNNKSGIADISEDFSGYIAIKDGSITNLTKLVVIISVLLAVLMVVSK